MKSWIFFLNLHFPQPKDTYFPKSNKASKNHILNVAKYDGIILKYHWSLGEALSVCLCLYVSRVCICLSVSNIVCESICVCLFVYAHVYVHVYLSVRSMFVSLFSLSVHVFSVFVINCLWFVWIWANYISSSIDIATLWRVAHYWWLTIFLTVFVPYTVYN